VDHNEAQPLDQAARPAQEDADASQKHFARLLMVAMPLALIFVAANPMTNIVTVWWASSTVPLIVGALACVFFWRLVPINPGLMWALPGGPPVKLGTVATAAVQIMFGLVLGAACGFLTREAIQSVGSALPSTDRIVSADVTKSWRSVGSKNRCRRFMTFNFSDETLQHDVCIKHAWRANVTDDEFVPGDLVDMTLRHNVVGEWVTAIRKNPSER
jgi:hypothetical protein